MNRFTRFLRIFLLLDVLSGVCGTGERDKLVNWISGQADEHNLNELSRSKVRNGIDYVRKSCLKSYEELTRDVTPIAYYSVLYEFV